MQAQETKSPDLAAKQRRLLEILSKGSNSEQPAGSTGSEPTGPQATSSTSSVDALMQAMSLLPSLPMQEDPLESPPGLERDPILLQLLKMGLPVTRAAWLTLDRGSSSEANLDAETRAFLDRHFPPEADLNRPETEEDGIRAEALRRLRVRQLLSAQPDRTPPSSPSPSNTPEKTEFPSDVKANTSK